MVEPLPTYTSTAQVQPAPILDPDGGWRALGQFASTGFAIGAQEVKQQKQNLLDADKQIAASQITQGLEKNRVESMLKFEDPVHQSAFYQQNSQTFLNQMVQNANPENRNYLMAVGGNLINSTVKNFDNDIVNQQKVSNSVNFQDKFQQKQDYMLDRIRNNDEVGAQNGYQQAVQTLDLYAASSGMSPAKVAQQKLALQKSYHSSLVLHQVNQLAQNNDREGLQKIYDKLFKKGLPGFDEEGIDNLISKSKTLFNNYQNAHLVNSRLAQNMASDIQANILAGKDVPQSQIDLVRGNLTDENKAIFDKEYNENIQTRTAANQYLSVPFTERSTLNDEIQKKLSAKQYNNFSTIINREEKLASQDPYSYALKSVPVQQAIQRNKQVQLANIQTQSNINPTNASLGSVSDAAIQYQKNVMGLSDDKIQAIPTVQAQGIANILSGNDPQAAINALSALKDQTKENYPIAFRNVMQHGKGRINPGMMFLGNSSLSDPNTITKFQVLATPVKDLQGNVVDDDKKNLKDYLTTTFSGKALSWYNSGNTDINKHLRAISQITSFKGSNDYKTALHDYIYKNALYLLGSGKTSSYKDAVEQASQDVISKFNYPTINGIETIIPTTYNGRPLIPDSVSKACAQKQLELKSFDYKIPGHLTGTTDPHLFSNLLPILKGALNIASGNIADTESFESAKQAFNNLKDVAENKDLLTALTNKGKGIDQPMQRQLYYNQYLTNGHWISNGSFDGLIFVDGANNPVVDKHNHPFELKYAQLQ